MAMIDAGGPHTTPERSARASRGPHAMSHTLTVRLRSRRPRRRGSATGRRRTGSPSAYFVAAPRRARHRQGAEPERVHRPRRRQLRRRSSSCSRSSAATSCAGAARRARCSTASAIIATLLATFFQLREILPAVSPWTDDARIYAFDLQRLRLRAERRLDRWVTPATTEWFAFFYFLYFLILCVHVLPMVFWQRDTHLLNRFATGVAAHVPVGAHPLHDRAGLRARTGT